MWSKNFEKLTFFTLGQGLKKSSSNQGLKEEIKEDQSIEDKVSSNKKLFI